MLKFRPAAHIYRLVTLYVFCAIGTYSVSVLLSAPANSQALTTSGNTPIEITADGSLEWDRKAKIFVAKTNAKAVQGAGSVAGDILRAKYRDASDTAQGGSDMQIYEFTAEGNVVLMSNDTAAYGNYAVYDLDSSVVTMTGQNLQMRAPNQTVTANERFEYNVAAGTLSAFGRPQITQQDANGQTNTLTSDRMTATLSDTAGGSRRLQTLEAFDNVIVKTPGETLTGAYGIYNGDTGTAEVRGNVKITRGPNILTGDRATVDMNTGISRMFGNQTQTGENGRVRGVFYPGSN